MTSIFDRFSEPSSFAGLGVIALAFGISQPLFATISTAVAGVCGLIAFLKKEGVL